MTTITVIDSDGEKHQIVTTHSVKDIDATLVAHGFDPETVEASISKSVPNRLADIEQAAGVGGPGKRGVAHRLDDLESRLEALEDDQS